MGLIGLGTVSNEACDVNGQMVVSARGFGTLSEDYKHAWCPVCRSKEDLFIKNIGFVNWQWMLKGVMNSIPKSVMTFSDRTYDKKLHVFKELDHKSCWKSLIIICQELAEENWRFMNDSQEYQSANT